MCVWWASSSSRLKSTKNNNRRNVNHFDVKRVSVQRFAHLWNCYKAVLMHSGFQMWRNLATTMRPKSLATGISRTNGRRKQRKTSLKERAGTIVEINWEKIVVAFSRENEDEKDGMCSAARMDEWKYLNACENMHLLRGRLIGYLRADAVDVWTLNKHMNNRPNRCATHKRMNR